MRSILKRNMSPLILLRADFNLVEIGLREWLFLLVDDLGLKYVIETMVRLVVLLMELS